MRIVVLCRRLRSAPGGPYAARLFGRCDEAALAAGLAARDAVPGSQLAVLAAGGPGEEDALREALARGAQHAVRVYDPSLDTVDYHGIARVLAAAVRHLGADLVLAGDSSEDEASGAVGPAVAENLGLPHLTQALDVSVVDGHLEVVRRDAGQLRRLKVAVPSVIAVASFAGSAAAASPEALADTPSIAVLDLAAIGLEARQLRHRDRCLGRAQPVPASTAEVLAEPAQLIARLRDHQLIRE